MSQKSPRSGGSKAPSCHDEEEDEEGRTSGRILDQIQRDAERELENASRVLSHAGSRRESEHPSRATSRMAEASHHSPIQQASGPPSRYPSAPGTRRSSLDRQSPRGARGPSPEHVSPGQRSSRSPSAYLQVPTPEYMSQPGTIPASAVYSRAHSPEHLSPGQPGTRPASAVYSRAHSPEYMSPGQPGTRPASAVYSRAHSPEHMSPGQPGSRPPSAPYSRGPSPEYRSPVRGSSRYQEDPMDMRDPSNFSYARTTDQDLAMELDDDMAEPLAAECPEAPEVLNDEFLPYPVGTSSRPFSKGVSGVSFSQSARDPSGVSFRGSMRGASGVSFNESNMATKSMLMSETSQELSGDPYCGPSEPQFAGASTCAVSSLCSAAASAGAPTREPSRAISSTCPSKAQTCTAGASLNIPPNYGQVSYSPRRVAPYAGSARPRSPVQLPPFEESPEEENDVGEEALRQLTLIGQQSPGPTCNLAKKCGAPRMDLDLSVCETNRKAKKTPDRSLPKKPELGLEEIRELIECESRDVDSAWYLTSDQKKTYKKPCPKQQKAQMNVKNMVHSHSHAAPRPTSPVCGKEYSPMVEPDPEDISPEVAAAMMFSQEQGIKLENSPNETIKRLFPDEPRGPMFGEKIPASSVSIVDPNQDQEELIEKSAEVPSEGVSDSAYTRMKQKGKYSEPECDDGMGNRPSYDLDFALGQEKQEYLLVPQRPQRFNKIQFRGNLPPWFPGYFCAFPDQKTPELQVVSSPSELFHRAWASSDPSTFPSGDVTVLE